MTSSLASVRKEIVGEAIVCLATPLVWASSTWHIWGCLPILWPDAPAGVVGIALHLLTSSGYSDNRGALHNVMVSCPLLPLLTCWTKAHTEEELVTGVIVSSGQQGRQRPQKEDIGGEERACPTLSSSAVSYKAAGEAGWCLPHHQCLRT